MRHLRRGASSERRLLRALRREDATGSAVGPAGDPGRAAVLPHGRGARDRLHLDLLSPAVAPADPLPNPFPGEREVQGMALEKRSANLLRRASSSGGSVTVNSASSMPR